MTSKILLLGIHGLPQSGGVPSGQLDPIRADLAADDRIVDRDPAFRWCEGSALRDALKRLGDGSFATAYVPAVAAALQPMPTDSPLLVVAYSSGGYLLYRWLVEYATDAERDRLAVVAIAAPYRCRTGGFRLKTDQRHPFAFGEANFNAKEIAAKLLPKRLLLVLAEHDTPVEFGDGAFTADEDGGAELVQRGTVRQRVVAGADHQSVCADPATFSHIRDFLANL